MAIGVRSSAPADDGSAAVGAHRVAIFIPSLAGGGAERVMLNLAGGLVARGVEVDLVVGTETGPYRSQVPSGVRLVDFGVRRVLLGLPPLIRYLRETRPSVLLTAMEHANLVGLWSRALARVPVRTVVSVHIAFSAQLLRSTSWWGRMVMKLAAHSYSNADAVVAVSEGVAADLVSKVGVPPSLLRVIHNPIVFPALFERADEAVDHAWYDTAAVPVILGVGRLDAQKDFGTLIRAVALVVASRPVRLRILGEGPERPALEALVRELRLEAIVDLAGFRENPFAHMRRARLVVLSSIYEGFGNILVEAMACGTPVVSTDCPSGPSEILAGGRFGRLVPPSDPAALAAAISAALDHPPDPEILVDRSKDFEVAKVVDRYLEVLFPGPSPFARSSRGLLPPEPHV